MVPRVNNLYKSQDTEFKIFIFAHMYVHLSVHVHRRPFNKSKERGGYSGARDTKNQKYTEPQVGKISHTI